MRLPLTSPHRPIFHQNVIMIRIIQGNIIENTLYHFGTSPQLLLLLLVLLLLGRRQ